MAQICAIERLIQRYFRHSCKFVFQIREFESKFANLGQIREFGPKFVTTNLGPQIRDIPDLVGKIVLGVVFALISRPPSLPDVAFAKPNFVRHQSTPIYCDNSNARAVLGATYVK